MRSHLSYHRDSSEAHLLPVSRRFPCPVFDLCTETIPLLLFYCTILCRTAEAGCAASRHSQTTRRPSAGRGCRARHYTVQRGSSSASPRRCASPAARAATCTVDNRGCGRLWTRRPGQAAGRAALSSGPQTGSSRQLRHESRQGSGAEGGRTGCCCCERGTSRHRGAAVGRRRRVSR